MKILDLRPLAVRLWERQDRDGLRAAGLAARLAGALGDALVRGRVARRDLPWPGLTVVSVGNLAFGGTGKTPVVAALGQALAAAGHQGGVLTRGYGSALAGPVEVRPGDERAGDEARLLAEALGPLSWPVVQARRRNAGLRWLASLLPAGAVVLLEDGHQTAGVGRQLDVLILDRWTVVGSPDGPRLQPASGPVVPCGPWRETAAGADRAGIWLVESVDPPALGVAGVPVAGFVRKSVLVKADGAPLLQPESRPWIALSGIARPARFEAGVASLLGMPARLAIRCADHAPYDGRLRSRIEAAIRQEGAPLTVTTEKDWIKLRAHWPADLPLAVARLQVRWTGRRPLPALVGERLVQPEGRSR